MDHRSNTSMRAQENGRGLSRRQFVGTVAGVSAAALTGCASSHLSGTGSIVDTHTHFYDPTRPQGVPWPPKEDSILYRRVMPEELKTIAKPLGVRGTIVVEASPWVEDNQWVLELAAREPYILGLVGHLKPGRSGFAQELARFATHPLFRGVRTGLWGVSIDSDSEPFVKDLRLLAERNLALDVIAGAGQLAQVERIAKSIPDLRIVVDHCAGVPVTGSAPPENWTAGIRSLARNRSVYMKVSGLVEGTGKPGQVPKDLQRYRPVMEVIWEAFGEDRVVFGSNWPVSARFADYATVLQIVREYFESKGGQASQKYFAGNAARVYRC